VADAGARARGRLNRPGAPSDAADGCADQSMPSSLGPLHLSGQPPNTIAAENLPLH
jgi:hypothetical protein